VGAELRRPRFKGNENTGRRELDDIDDGVAAFVALAVVGV